MSLLPYPLILSTKGNGTGTVKKFTTMGEIKRILYRDLLEILESHRNFAEAGYFYIMDKRFIRQQGLDEMYSKILTKEKIEEIIRSTEPKHCVEIFNSANEKQKEIIVELLIDKLATGSSVDLNVVDAISRASKVDISKLAEDAKGVQSKAEE
jgi:hypothetical protein